MCTSAHYREKKKLFRGKNNQTKQNKKTKQEKQPIETREGGKARDKVIFGSDQLVTKSGFLRNNHKRNKATSTLCNIYNKE